MQLRDLPLLLAARSLFERLVRFPASKELQAKYLIFTVRVWMGGVVSCSVDRYAVAGQPCSEILSQPPRNDTYKDPIYISDDARAPAQRPRP